MAGKGKVAVSALEAVRRAMAEAQPKLIRASEALAPHEGKILKPLQYDRMRVNLDTNDLGGGEYSGLSLYNPPHAEAGAVAAVSNKTALSRLVNQYKDLKPGSVIHTPQLGSEIQHRGNPTMFARFYNELMDKFKNGEVDQEQIDVINNKLNSLVVGPASNKKPLFAEPIDIASPEFRLRPLTFLQRSEFADVVGGKGIIKELGKEKGKIININERLGESIDPYIADAPTGAFGHRLVELGTNTLYDPALHGDYPYHIIGKDFGVRFKPVEKEYMTDFAKQIMEDPNKARLPSDMDFRTGNVSQEITPEWLQILKDAGNKDGGAIRKANGGTVQDDTQYIQDDPTAYLLNQVRPIEDTKIRDAIKFAKTFGSGNMLGRLTGSLVGGIQNTADETAQEVKRLKPQSAIDIPVNAAAEAVGFPMDIASDLVERAAPIRSDVVAPRSQYATSNKPLPFTSQALKQRAKEAGITSGEEFPNLQLGTQFISPSLVKPIGAAVKGYGNLVKEGIERNIGMIEPRMGIIKDQGGMLVGGEKALDNELLYMKKTENAYPYAQAHFATDQKDTDAQALNNWIDTKVRKYLRNQAGTEADPILKTIESGVEHNFQPALGDTKYSQKIKRASVGKPEEGIAKTELGKEFEYKVDSMFNPKKSKDIKEILNDPMEHADASSINRRKASILRVEQDLPIDDEADFEALKLINQIPDENVYTLSGTNITERLGLNHVSDVLMEDLRSGKLKPEQLNQMSIEKAIRRTAEYDAEKAKAMAKANASSVEGMPIPKAYDDGYKWVELKHETDPTKTKAALKSEGEMMGHCVGGYCPDVESGEIKIFSLRSPDGKSHVTIEARPQFSMTLWRNANMDAINSNPKLKEYDFNMRSLDDDNKYGRQMTERDYVREMTKEMKKLGINPVEPPSYMELHQVKGKQNKRPDDKYQSYISDFIKNNPTKHEIVDVYELDNTNLMGVQNIADNGLVSKDVHFHPEVTKALKIKYPEFDNLMYGDKDIKTYNLFREVARDFARQNKNYLDKDDILNHIREKYLTPPAKAKGGPINLETEYKLENMRRRYG